MSRLEGLNYKYGCGTGSLCATRFGFCDPEDNCGYGDGFGDGWGDGISYIQHRTEFTHNNGNGWSYSINPLLEEFKCLDYLD